jgi:hypothetical protein
MTILNIGNQVSFISALQILILKSCIEKFLIVEADREAKYGNLFPVKDIR